MGLVIYNLNPKIMEIYKFLKRYQLVAFLSEGNFEIIVMEHRLDKLWDTVREYVEIEREFINEKLRNKSTMENEFLIFFNYLYNTYYRTDYLFSYKELLSNFLVVLDSIVTNLIEERRIEDFDFTEFMKLTRRCGIRKKDVEKMEVMRLRAKKESRKSKRRPSFNPLMLEQLAEILSKCFKTRQISEFFNYMGYPELCTEPFGSKWTILKEGFLKIIKKVKGKGFLEFIGEFIRSYGPDITIIDEINSAIRPTGYQFTADGTSQKRGFLSKTREQITKKIDEIINALGEHSEIETKYFSDKTHKELLIVVKDWFNKQLKLSHEIQNTHGLQERGIDTIAILNHYYLFGIQVKSQFDMLKPNFKKELDAQITRMQSHPIEYWLIILCGNLTDKAIAQKVPTVKQTIININRNFPPDKKIKIIGPRAALSIFK